MSVNFLAELWGISLVIIPLALLVNPAYLKRIFAECDNDTTMLFWGITTLVIGLAMILSFNVWERDWQVVITILGWLVFLKGCAILLIPSQIKSWAKKLETSSLVSYALVIMVFVGLVLAYFGFTS